MIIDKTQQPLAICGWGCRQVSLQQFQKTTNEKGKNNQYEDKWHSRESLSLFYFIFFTKDQPASHKSFIVALLFCFYKLWLRTRSLRRQLSLTVTYCTPSPSVTLLCVSQSSVLPHTQTYKHKLLACGAPVIFLVNVVYRICRAAACKWKVARLTRLAICIW